MKLNWCNVKGRDDWEQTVVRYYTNRRRRRVGRANGVGLLACPVDKRLQAPKEFSSTMRDPLDVMSTRPIS